MQDGEAHRLLNISDDFNRERPGVEVDYQAMRMQARGAERASEPQANGLTALLCAIFFTHRSPIHWIAQCIHTTRLTEQ